MHVKTSSAKMAAICLGLNVINDVQFAANHVHESC